MGTPKLDGHSEDSDESEDEPPQGANEADDRLFQLKNEETERKEAKEVAPTTEREVAVSGKRTGPETSKDWVHVVAVAKRQEDDKLEEEKKVANPEDVLLSDSDSELSGKPLRLCTRVAEEPKNCDLLLGQYTKVQRIKRKHQNTYRCTFKSVILRCGQVEYVAADATGDFNY